jgi:dUTPase
MSVFSGYVLKLVPVSDDARELYQALLGGNSKKFPDNDNAGFDLVLAEDYNPVKDSLPNVFLAKLGVRAVLLNKFTNQTVHFWLAPRSSIWKNGVTLANSMGVIDRTYRGELMAALMTHQFTSLKKNTRLVQIIAPDMGHITEVILCNENDLDVTSRGAGGFGSTG